MDRSLKLLIAAGVLASAPVPALAQAWPAIVVSSANAMAPQIRSLAPDVRYNPAVGASVPTRMTRPEPSEMMLRPALRLEASQVPDVDIRAKDEWFDDQGFRASPTRVAFKRRF